MGLHKLKKLKLAGIMKNFDLRNEEVIRNNYSYQEFIEILISDEISNRQINSNQKRISKTKSPPIQDLKGIQF